MNDPSRVRVGGPLGPFAAGFRSELEARGYAPGSVALQLQLAAQLSRWLGAQDLDVSDLTSARLKEFFGARRQRVRVLSVSPSALKVLMGHLGDLGMLPAPQFVEPTPLDLLLARYRKYLRQERGLGERTVARYVYVAGRFLQCCSGGEGLDLGAVSASAAAKFLTLACAAHTTGWAKAVAVSLRCLLRFLHLEGLIAAPLAGAVPTPAGWANASLPKALKAPDLAALLASCDRRSTTGRRDYAVLVLLARLGLRAGEVAALQVADVDWRRAEVRVHGKGPRLDVLPLPAEVGKALADYVTRGRPRAAGGALFRRVGAPHGALAPTSVTGIVYRACERAGLPRAGAHRLRHTAATQMLQGGASLAEIAQVLRQHTPAATALYAKVDRQSLAAVAQCWPGEPA
ncbi:MAG TPA: tyrosine-type recombinase/integrase [Acidimicrobiales bacterium]|nr:tyrosine-type recombinase/integrase [Acidimicrobiales bacterium]